MNELMNELINRMSKHKKSRRTHEKWHTKKKHVDLYSSDAIFWESEIWMHEEL